MDTWFSETVIRPTARHAETLEKTFALNFLVDVNNSRLIFGFIIHRSIIVSLLTSCPLALDTCDIIIVTVLRK